MGLIWDLPFFPAKNSPFGSDGCWADGRYLQLSNPVCSQCTPSSSRKWHIPRASSTPSDTHCFHYPSSCRVLLANRPRLHVRLPLGSVQTRAICDQAPPPRTTTKINDGRRQPPAPYLLSVSFGVNSLTPPPRTSHQKHRQVHRDGVIVWRKRPGSDVH